MIMMGNMDDGQMIVPQIAPNPQIVQAIEDAPCAVCECGNKTFHDALIIKKVPGAYFGEKEPVMKAIPVYVCDKCGKIMSEMLEDPKMARLIGEEPKKKENLLTI